MRAELGRVYDQLTQVSVQAQVNGALVAQGSLTVTAHTAGGKGGFT